MYLGLAISSALGIVLLLSLGALRGKIQAIIISGGAIVLAALIAVMISDVAAAMVFMVLSALLCGLELIRFITRNKINRFIPPILAFVITVVYFTHAYIIGHGFNTTRYELELGSDLRIAQLTDTHLGSFFDLDDLERCVQAINEAEPDLVVITGDFVDENTEVEDMRKGCKILSELHSTYGTFYVPGNHDGHWGENTGVKNAYPKLEKELIDNNVTVLADKACTIGDDYIVIGRYDKWFEDSAHTKRVPIKKILERFDLLDTNRKIIVLDHRPFELDSLANYKDVRIDLVLSGHTHGGQIFPVTIFYRLFTGDDYNIYGLRKIRDMYSITSSGASSGEAPFKNTVPNEIVIIDIT